MVSLSLLWRLSNKTKKINQVVVTYASDDIKKQHEIKRILQQVQRPTMTYNEANSADAYKLHAQHEKEKKAADAKKHAGVRTTSKEESSTTEHGFTAGGGPQAQHPLPHAPSNAGHASSSATGDNVSSSSHGGRRSSQDHGAHSSTSPGRRSSTDQSAAHKHDSHSDTNKHHDRASTPNKKQASVANPTTFTTQGAGAAALSALAGAGGDALKKRTNTWNDVMQAAKQEQEQKVMKKEAAKKAAEGLWVYKDGIRDDYERFYDKKSKKLRLMLEASPTESMLFISDMFKEAKDPDDTGSDGDADDEQGSKAGTAGDGSGTAGDGSITDDKDGGSPGSKDESTDKYA